MKSDEELNKTFTVEVIDGGIVYSSFLEALPDGKEDTRRAELYRDAMHAAINSVAGTGKVNGIVDMTLLGGKIITPPAKAGKLYSEAAEHPRTGKVAIVGVETMYRVLVKFFLIAAHKGDSVKLFTTKEDALAWLKESL